MGKRFPMADLVLLFLKNERGKIMLNYKALVHSDDFETEVICWVDVTGVPQQFVDEAKQIDGRNYISDGFGVCIQYDRDNEEYFAVEEEPGCNLYYTNNKGDGAEVKGSGKYGFGRQGGTADSSTAAANIRQAGNDSRQAGFK